MKLLALLAVVTCFTSQVKGDCTNIEIVWVLDVSGTISQSQFASARTFVKSVMNSVTISSNGNKAGISYFGNQGHRYTHCEDHSSTTSFNQAVDGVPQLVGELTNTEDGMRKGKYILENNGCGQRSGVTQIMVLVTDGQANEGGDENSLYAMSKEIRDSGIDLYAVAVGKFDLSQLNQMTDPENVFRASGFQMLNMIISTLTDAVCATTNPPGPTTAATTTTTTTAPTTSTTTSTTTSPTTTTTTTRTTTTSPTTTTTPTTSPTTTTTPTTPSTTPTTSTTTSTTTRPTISTELECTCSVENIENYTCLKWTKYEVMKNFNGTCYTDKLKKAIEYVAELITKAAEKITEIEQCKDALKIQLSGSVGNSGPVFEAYDNCLVLGNCKLTNFHAQLLMKKMMLEKEMKLEQEGYGGILQNSMDWFQSMMMMSKTW